MPIINTIQELDNFVEAVGKTELNNLFRIRNNLSQNLRIENSLWNVKIKAPILRVLRTSSTEINDYFDKNEEKYKDTWIEKVKVQFGIDTTGSKKKWKENLSQSDDELGGKKWSENLTLKDDNLNEKEWSK